MTPRPDPEAAITDGDALAHIRHRLETGFPDCEVWEDAWLLYRDTAGHDLEARRVMGQDDVIAARACGLFARHPDFLVVCGGKPVFIAEYDGSVHDAKVTRTEARDGEYDALGIHHVTVRWDCFTDLLWEERLRVEARKCGEAYVG